MSKPRRLFLATLACALLAGITWLALRETEPHYQGKPLSFWLQAFESDRSHLGVIVRDRLFTNKSPAAFNNLEAAMKAAGTNSFPVLLQYLRASDDTWPRKLRLMASKQTLVPVKYTAAHSLVRQGRIGIMTLGESASAMVPELLVIYRESPSPYARNAVILSLGAIGKNAESAIPLLVRAYQEDSTLANRYDVVGALGDIHSRPEIVVPILIDALAAKDQALHYQALIAVGKFGPDAKSAIPAIQRLEETDPPAWGPHCTKVLTQILGPLSIEPPPSGPANLTRSTEP